jgi:hypothetical protein
MLADNDHNNIEESLPEVTEETPQFKNIYIKNVHCKGAYQAVYLQGLPEMNLENVHLENLMMEAENGLMCIDANGIKIKDLQLKTSQSPGMTFYNSKNVSISNLDLSESTTSSLSIKGEKTENIDISTHLKAQLILGEEVDTKEVKIR